MIGLIRRRTVRLVGLLAGAVAAGAALRRLAPEQVPAVPQLPRPSALLDRYQPPAGPETVFLGLGSNMGDPLQALNDAVRRLDATDGITVADISGVYLTTPMGGPEQDDFHNIVIAAQTTRSPNSLLRACQQVEDDMGRTRTVRWGPRIIDVDVLLFGDRTVDDPAITIPHPRLAERAFALIPLAELVPGWVLPDGRSISSCIAALAPIEGIDAIGAHVSLQPPPPMPDWLEEAKRRAAPLGRSELLDAGADESDDTP